MTISNIGIQTDNLQVLRAQNAFRKTLENLEKSKQSAPPAQEADIKDSVSSNTFLHGTYEVSKSANEPVMGKDDKYVSEVKDFINKYNLTDIEEGDIKDAMKYGTSILADYTA
jgi:hypothetical protein